MWSHSDGPTAVTHMTPDSGRYTAPSTCPRGGGSPRPGPQSLSRLCPGGKGRVAPLPPLLLARGIPAFLL